VRGGPSIAYQPIAFSQLDFLMWLQNLSTENSAQIRLSVMSMAIPIASGRATFFCAEFSQLMLVFPLGVRPAIEWVFFHVERHFMPTPVIHY